LKNHSDEQTLKAQQWMGENCGNKFSIDGVAEFTGISPRNFKRRLKKCLRGNTPSVRGQKGKG